MQTIKSLILSSLTLIIFFIHSSSFATFNSKFPCSNTTKVCISGAATRIIEGFPLSKSCWEYRYIKTCNYPSKNDCMKWAHCYAIADRECLLKDSLGNCVNQMKEFSCKKQQIVKLKKERAEWDPKDQARSKQLICKGIPCVDGNCVDKSYDMNSEMMDSVSKLYVISEASKGAYGSNLFPGSTMHCTKKAADYSNCCNTGNKESSFNNWGHDLGAKCTPDERLLINKRNQNLCVYVGKTGKGGISTTPVKHHYCCFGSILNKVFQIEARKQLGLNFDSGENPSCRGLTLDELMRVDFERMDLSEAYHEILKKMKLPTTGDIDSRVKGSFSNIKQGTKDEFDRENKKGGVNTNLEKTLGNEDDY